MTNHTDQLADMLILSVYDKEADYVIGTPDDPCLQRWWLRKDNLRGNIYLHRIFKNAETSNMHDHPFCSTTLILKGSVREILETHERTLEPGSITYRHATERHRLEVLKGPVWSLFITGSKEREWGAFDQNGAWLHPRLMVNEQPKGLNTNN